ncbi:MAG: hypothetical protein HOE90_18225 [Bacteriovoracaceae bacterium]|nr:hypothetical protein [Bacteriovoracaceae bacterium]
MKAIATILYFILVGSSWAESDNISKWRTENCKLERKRVYSNQGWDFRAAGGMLIGPGVFTTVFIVPGYGVATFEAEAPFIDFSRSTDKIIAGTIVSSAVLTAGAFGVSELMKKSATRGLLFLETLSFSLESQRNFWPRGFRSLYKRYGEGLRERGFAQKILIQNQNTCVPFYREIVKKIKAKKQ